MIRYYIFRWYKNGEWGKPTERTNKIVIQNPSGDTSKDAKKAVDLFVRGFGNLKKNTIISIKEFGEEGQIGEDIVPTNDSIIPTKK